MVPAAREEGVVQVGQVRDHALLLSHAEHAQVPLAQVVAARRLLPRRVAVQDVVIALYTQQRSGSCFTKLVLQQLHSCCHMVPSEARNQDRSHEAPQTLRVSSKKVLSKCCAKARMLDGNPSHPIHAIAARVVRLGEMANDK